MHGRVDDLFLIVTGEFLDHALCYQEQFYLRPVSTPNNVSALVEVIV